MLPRRPYLIRALYEWLVDAGEVPHLLVDATAESAQLPDAYVHEGRIVLNVGPSAVQFLDLGNDEISFSARFGGSPRKVSFPPSAVIAVYGRDSGQGMMFGPEEDSDEEPETTRAEDSKKSRKPSLKVIK